LFDSVLVILGGKSGRRKGGVGPIAGLLLEKKERKKNSSLADDLLLNPKFIDFS
jgi:hypothetical protein